MKVTIFGSGYVGLVSGICLAEIGHEVVSVDTDEKKIEMLRHGESPIFENGLDELLEKNLAAKKISFTTDAKQGIEHGDYIFIAVGTPSASDGTADLRYVYEVARTIGKNLNKYAVVINKSTVPVGTADKVSNLIKKELTKRKIDIKFDMASNPEFLKQGDAVKDFMCSDRLIIGAETEEVLNKMFKLYESLDTRIVTMDIRSAEVSKYAANAFLATKISFVNEIAQFAEKFDADIHKIKEGIGTDSRIGSAFLNAGCGYGGSCFPKDVKALIWMAREHGIESPLFNAVEDINLRQKYLISSRLQSYFNEDLEGKIIALWGLAFKPNTDDMREAPSKVLLESLWRLEAKVQAYDPVAMKEAERIYGKRGDFKLCETAEDALEGADVLVIVTEWDEFKSPDFEMIKSKLKNPVIFDGRNLFSPTTMKEMGIKYHGIGCKK